jgi:hypothetical protein
MSQYRCLKTENGPFFLCYSLKTRNVEAISELYEDARSEEYYILLHAL